MVDKESSYLLFFPERKLLEQHSMFSCLDVPCIFDEEWVYQAIPSCYLRHRKILRTPAARSPNSKKRIPGDISMKNYGYWLCNFLEWIAARGKDWRTLQFVEDILLGYQSELQNGKWSVSGTPLKPRTINSRVGVACDYLEWAADKGYRNAFKVGVHPVQVSIASGTQTSISPVVEKLVRDGTVRIDPSFLRMPRDDEVKRWLRSVLTRMGYVKCLMCRLIIASAIRREECVQWQLDTIPLNPMEWDVTGETISIEIYYGTKGSKFPLGNGLSIGPRRMILIPLKLAEEIHEYRSLKRVQLQAKFVKAGKTPSARKHRKDSASRNLFLSEHTGRPISAQMLYLAWTDVPGLPYKGFSPHIGRHYWACKKLILRCAPVLGVNTLNAAGQQTSESSIKPSVEDVIALEIKPQLGHISVQTSQAYLVWMQRLLHLPEIYDLYQDTLNGII